MSCQLHILSKVYNRLKNNLTANYRRQCIRCGLLAGKYQVCAQCLAQLPWRGQSCQQCGVVLYEPADRCGRCIVAPPYYDETFVAFDYDSPVRDWVQVFKYAEGFQYGHVLANLLCDCMPKEFTADVIAPVPLHRKRIFKRGFNQAALLAQAIRHKTAIPVDYDLVRRKHFQRAQVGLSKKQRQKNIRNAFLVKTNFADKRILLVDDVITTGNTVNEIARILKINNAAWVKVVAIAKVD